MGPEGAESDGGLPFTVLDDFGAEQSLCCYTVWFSNRPRSSPDMAFAFTVTSSTFTVILDVFVDWRVCC